MARHTDLAAYQHSLRETLTAAARNNDGDLAAQRAAALAILKTALAAGRTDALSRLDGRRGGLEAAKALSAAADTVIGALFDFTVSHVARASNPTEGERVALVAVGGYGRGLLAPFSDVDLVFLRAWKLTAHVENVIEFMLYALWDLGFKVGHASRTLEECLNLARKDSSIATALLDARRLAGDERLAAELSRRFRQEVVKGSAREFVAAKLRERDARHARAGASRYLVEPNIKEGKGALRDLDTLFWIARYLDPKASPDRLRLKAFDKREAAAFGRAADFLWTARIRLHDLKGRAEERLTFDLQARIARRMGYGGASDGEAVERFMRRYFTTARQVGELTRTFCAELEAGEAKPLPLGLSRFLPGGPARRGVDAAGFHESAGRLNIDGPEVLRRNPVNILRLFSLADRLDLDLHPHALTAVHRALPLITPKVQGDAKAVEALLDVLARGKRPFETLTRMNEAGVLGAFVPEFGRILAQMQFNMFHAYTVDEHTLRGVGIIADMAAGRLADDHPLATAIFPLIGDREALFLAMLLHDTGKGGREAQEIGGERAARTACRRMGLTPARAELVAWLVRHHLVMSDTAQKRDVRDPMTVETFARIVETPERLRMLTILTGADIRAVGPGVWNGWKGQLLRELYMATEARLRGADRGADIAARRIEIEAALGAPAARFAEAMGEAYLTGAGEDQIALHTDLADAAMRDGAALSARHRAEHNALELSVAARDRPGLFADLASALAANGAEVTGASAATSPGGMAVDVFYLQDAVGAPFGIDDPGRMRRLTTGVRPADAGLSIQSAHVASFGEQASDVFYVRDEAGGKLSFERAAEVRTRLLQVLAG